MPYDNNGDDLGFDGHPVGDAIQAGLLIAESDPIGDSTRFFTQVVPAGAKLETFDLHQLEDAYADRPRRKTGVVHVRDADSFIGYLAKHGLDETEVWADTKGSALVGVINAHQAAEGAAARQSDAVAGLAGHGDHRVLLELVLSKEWQTWTGLDRQWLTRQDFAEHIEDNAIDVIDPDGATMLEIAQSFQATLQADFKEAQRLSSGEVAFKYVETVQAQAGQAGEFEVPTSFTVAMSPFEGGDPVEVEAKFRYRLRAGELKVSYALTRPHDIQRQAYLDLVQAVDDGIPHPVFRGRPA